MEINFILELFTATCVHVEIIFNITTHKQTHASIKAYNIYTTRLVFSKLLVQSAHSSLFNETPVSTDILSFVSHRCSSSRNNHHSSAVRNMTPYKLAITWENASKF